MCRRTIFLLSLIIALLFVVLVYPESDYYPQFADRVERVILISIDSALSEYIAPNIMPNLFRLLSRGFNFTNVYTTFTCNTIPAHVAMLTGAYPERTGIIGNAYHFKENGTTIIANRLTLRKAQTIIEANPEIFSVFISGKWWLGPILSNGSDYIINAPRGRIPPTEPYDFNIPVSGLSGDANDYWTISAMIEIARKIDFDFMFVNLAWCDDLQHVYGPLTEPIKKYMHELDRMLKEFFDALIHSGKFSTTLFVITSDHTQSKIRKSVNILRHLTENGINAYVQNEGTAAIIFLEDSNDIISAAKLLRELEGVEKIFIRGINYSLLHIPENYGDIIVSLADGYCLPASVETPMGHFWSDITINGQHGGLHTSRVFLFFVGPRIKRGRYLGEVSIVDIVPTIVSIMGWNLPKQCEGRDLSGIIFG